MAAFTDLLTDDESVAVKAAGDFATLIPAHQRAAYGTDGTLSTWDLTTSAAVGGLGSGHVLKVQKGAGGEWSDLLAVESVASGVITLRRIGMDPGDGPPPSPPAGTSAVNFYAPTARPQIQQATRSILRRFGFADYAAIAAARDGQGDAEDFRALATLTVLIDLLGTQHRAGNGEENFHTKYKDLIAERDALAAELVDEYEVASPADTAKPLVAGVMTFPTYRRSSSEF